MSQVGNGNLYKQLICVGVVIVAVYVTYKVFFKRDKEGFSIILGMGAPQNRFYSKCVDDCLRDKTGDSYPGQFQWLCTHKCLNVANTRRDAGIPDLTSEEYQRHIQPLLPPPLDKPCNWESNDLEGCYCLQDVKTWCEQRYCPFSKKEDCIPDCMRVHGVQCGGQGVTGGWRM